MRDQLLKDPFTTYSRLIGVMRSRHGVTLSSGSIRACLKKAKFARKRVHKTTWTPELEVERKTYSQRVQSMNIDSVISIDESSFYIDMKPLYGYGQKGKRLTIPKTVFKQTDIPDCTKSKFGQIPKGSSHASQLHQACIESCRPIRWSLLRLPCWYQ